MSRWLYNTEAIRTWAEGGATDNNIRWWTPETTVPQNFQVGEFIGQGRRIQYYSLSHATLGALDNFPSQTNTKEDLDQCAQKVVAELHGRKRPAAWYVAATLANSIVWAAVISALAVTLMSPQSVALVCRMMTILLFGVFSSVSWAVQFFAARPSRAARWVCHLSNALAAMALIVAGILQVRFLIPLLSLSGVDRNVLTAR